MMFTVASTARSQPMSVAGEACSNERVDREHAAALHVRDAMVATPKTVPAAATVAELRRLFANPHVVTAVLVDGLSFAGVVQRTQLHDRLDDRQPARTLATREVPTTHPDAPLSDALALLDADGSRRLIVLDPDGQRLRGLLCLTGDRSGFCQS